MPSTSRTEGDAQATLLEVQDLAVRFPTPAGDVCAVDGVGFELQAGETLGVVGESGSGKSLTALALLDLVPPPGQRVTGSIRLRGEDLCAGSSERWHQARGKQLAMVFQEPRSALNPVLPIGEQVAEVARLHLGMAQAEAQAHAVQMLERVGLAGGQARAMTYPHELSGGMCQRVMLAMAMACDPAVLIADEPTTALDVTTQAQILDLITELQTQSGMGVLLITHDLALVAERAQRVVVLYAGKVVEAGPTREVFVAPRHPYTRGLLACVPDPTGGRTLAAIPGSVPSALQLPDGCSFHPRCALVEDRCSREEPALIAAPDPSRTAACFCSDGVSAP